MVVDAVFEPSTNLMIMGNSTGSWGSMRYDRAAHMFRVERARSTATRR